MKKRGIIFFIAGFMIIAASVLSFGDIFGSRPFRQLESSNVRSAGVSAFPPDITAEIKGEEEIKKLVNILKTIVIYQKDDSGRDYDGQLVQFALSMDDGSMLEVGAYGSFLFINGVCYRTKYEPCEELNALGNILINAYVK